jgi:hypothetical protein
LQDGFPIASAGSPQRSSLQPEPGNRLTTPSQIGVKLHGFCENNAGSNRDRKPKQFHEGHSSDQCRLPKHQTPTPSFAAVVGDAMTKTFSINGSTIKMETATATMTKVKPRQP